MDIKDENVNVVRSFTVQSGVRRIDCGFIEDKEDTTKKVVRIMNNQGVHGQYDFEIEGIKMAYGFEKLKDSTYGLAYLNEEDKSFRLAIFKFNFKTPELIQDEVLVDDLLLDDRDYQFGVFKNDKYKPLLTLMVGSSDKPKEGEEPTASMGSFVSTLYDIDCKHLDNIKIEEKPSFSPHSNAANTAQLSPEKQATLQQKISEYLKANPPKESDRINIDPTKVERVDITDATRESINTNVIEGEVIQE